MGKGGRRALSAFREMRRGDEEGKRRGGEETRRGRDEEGKRVEELRS